MNINQKFDDFYKQLNEEEKSTLIRHINKNYQNLNIVMEGLNAGKLAIMDGINAGPTAHLNTNVCKTCGR